jgi:hypothetical protein
MGGACAGDQGVVRECRLNVTIDPMNEPRPVT